MPTTPATIPDINMDTVAGYMVDVAQRHIMPAFRNLRPDQISKKQAGEVVTEIDIMAERDLARLLTDYLPGSRVLGEEGFEADSSLMDLCMSHDPVWIIDPIDGTRNFIDGNAHFAMMVSFHWQCKTRAAWIHDPVRDLMYTAVAGEGAQFNGRPVRSPQTARSPHDTLCSLGNRLRNVHDQALARGVTGLPSVRNRLRCCGQEYLSLIRDEIQVLQYGVRLKPWDHAPGVLIAAEAGYYAAFLDDESPYDASLGINDGYLLIAPDRESWLGLKRVLWDSQG